MQDLPYLRIQMADLNKKFELAQKSDQIGPQSDQIGSSNQLMNRLQLKKIGIESIAQQKYSFFHVREATAEGVQSTTWNDKSQTA